MKTLEAYTKANNTQGGTIHQAMEHARQYGTVGTSAYMLGLGDGRDIRSTGIVTQAPDWNIPYNSFGNSKAQLPDYLLGMSNSACWLKGFDI